MDAVRLELEGIELLILEQLAVMPHAADIAPGLYLTNATWLVHM